LQRENIRLQRENERLQSENERLQQERERLISLNLENGFQDNNEILNQLEEVELNEQFKNKEEIKCIICLEAFSIGDKISYLPCFHYFHSSCIKNWIKIKNKCPFCNNIIKFS